MQLRRMIYHSGTVKLEKRYSYGLTLLGVLYLPEGHPELPGQSLPAHQLMRAVTGLTQKYRFVSSMLYELPFGKGKPFLNHSRLLDWVAGGWSFSWNYSIWAPPRRYQLLGGHLHQPCDRRERWPAGLSEL